MPTKTTAELFRSARESRFLSLPELASLSGVGRVTLWRIETQGRQPRHETVRLVAKALDIDPADLLGDDDSRREVAC